MARQRASIDRGNVAMTTWLLRLCCGGVLRQPRRVVRRPRRCYDKPRRRHASDVRGDATTACFDDRDIDGLSSSTRLTCSNDTD